MTREADNRMQDKCSTLTTHVYLKETEAGKRLDPNGMDKWIQIQHFVLPENITKQCKNITKQPSTLRDWATGLSLATPFREGCPGATNKASPPGRHQEQAPKQRCTCRPATFSSVQF